MKGKWDRKHYFEIPAFLSIEQGITSQKIQSNVTICSN